MAKPHYEWTSVRGVKCIVWATKTNDTGLTNKQQAKIKKEKDRVGRSNLDTPILDKMKVGSRSQYCNIIIYTDFIDDWDMAIGTNYVEQRQKTSNIQGGYQIIISDEEDDDIFLSVIVYRTRKIMIQPGNREEKHLLTFLTHFQGISDSLSSTGADDTMVLEQEKPLMESSSMESNEDENNVFNGHDCVGRSHDVHNTSISSANQKSSAPEVQLVNTFGSPQQRVLPQEKESNSCENTEKTSTDLYMPACNLRVNLPPSDETETHYVKDISSKDCNLQMKLHYDKVTVNEVLCFIFNKMKKLPQDHIIKLCSDFYDEKEIDAGKSILFHDTEHVRNSKLRHIKRKGEHKKKNDLQDIMHVFNSIELCHMPTYVARDLSNLPPLSAYDTDVVGLHRDVQELKASMRLVLESRVEIKSLTQTLNDKLATLSDNTLQVPQMCGPTSTSTQSPVATSEDHLNPAQDSIVSITTLDSSSEEDESLAKTHSDEEHNSNLTSRSLSYANAAQRDQQNATSWTPGRSSSTLHTSTRDITDRDIGGIRQQDALTWKTQGISHRTRTVTNSSN